MSKFKIGDSVVVVASVSYSGKTGKVLNIANYHDSDKALYLVGIDSTAEGLDAEEAAFDEYELEFLS